MRSRPPVSPRLQLLISCVMLPTCLTLHPPGQRRQLRLGSEAFFVGINSCLRIQGAQLQAWTLYRPTRPWARVGIF